MTEALKPSVRERFCRLVRENCETGCHEWTGHRRPNGYGGFNLSKGVNRSAHRVAYELAFGPIPAGLVVMHECDNRGCVNPAHLRAGTQQANIRDMYARGRGHDQRGANSHRAKLSPADVSIIRCSTEPPRVLAERFGVHQGSIGKILAGKRWTNVG